MKDDRPFAFAGLWEGWKDPATEEWLGTCEIITSDPNELVAQVHTRMPAILPEEHHAKWLGEIEDGDLKQLLKPYPADQMKMWPISQRVNGPKNDDPSLIEPIRALSLWHLNEQSLPTWQIASVSVCLTGHFVAGF
jgi:putative SOS response-associated peptidase YedK